MAGNTSVTTMGEKPVIGFIDQKSKYYSLDGTGRPAQNERRQEKTQGDGHELPDCSFPDADERKRRPHRMAARA